MSAPTATPPQQRLHRPHVHLPAAWTVPFVLGVCYGGYAGYLHHDQGAAEDDAIILGVVAGAVTAVVCYLVGRWRHRLVPELRGGVFGAVIGAAVGYLHVLSGATDFSSAVIGALVGLVAAGWCGYVFHGRSGPADGGPGPRT